MATTKKEEPALPAGLHKDGCPAERVEAFALNRPHGAGQVTVVRCIDCGADLHIDDDEKEDRNA